MKWNILPVSLRKKLAEKTLKDRGYFQSQTRIIKHWSEIKHITFLVDGSQPETLRLFLNRLERYTGSGKKTTLLGYVKKYPPFDQDGIKWFTDKDLNWLGVPNESVIRSLHMQPIDVLINTSNIGLMPLHYVSAMSKAGLRIGHYDPQWSDYYDFMLADTQGNIDLLLDQAEFYLSQFNQSHARIS